MEVSSNISVEDIPFLLQNDYSIYRKQIAPIISSNEYKQWLLTEGVHTVVVRKNSEIIGQMWAHPLELYYNNEPINKQFYWIHNIKIHPDWQSKGIYRQIADYCNEQIFSKNVQRLLLVNTSNNRMRHLAIKSNFFPVLSIFGVILFRYFFSPRTTKTIPLKIFKSYAPPESWIDLVLQGKGYWIPRFSWDNSPKWYSFYFNNKLVCVLQVTWPIHRTQGISISKFSIILHTAQIRYFSFSNHFLKLQPSIIRSIFTTLFRIYPRINALICTLNPGILARLLKFPRVLIPSQTFILYSTTGNMELINNNFEFRNSGIILNQGKKQ